MANEKKIDRETAVRMVEEFGAVGLYRVDELQAIVFRDVKYTVVDDGKTYFIG